MMTLLTWCLDCCRKCWTSLKQNCCQHLTLIYMIYHIPQIWLWLLWWDSLLIIPPSSLLLGICCDNVWYISNFCYWGGICLHLTLPEVSAVCHDVLSSPWAMFAETQDMWYNFWCNFLCWYQCLPTKLIHVWVVLFFQYPCSWDEVGPILAVVDLMAQLYACPS